MVIRQNVKALLFSGGIDSSAILYWKRPNISFYIDYGQRNSKGELRAVKIISKELKIPFEIISVNCSKLGKGILSGDKTSPQEVLSEWWPYRNQLLITLAAMKGIQLGIKTLFIGSVKEDKI